MGWGSRAEGLAGTSGGQRHLSHLAGPHAPATLPRSRRQQVLLAPTPGPESSVSPLPVRTPLSRLREGCRTHPQNAPYISLAEFLLALTEAAETELGPLQWEIYFPKSEPQGV